MIFRVLRGIPAGPGCRLVLSLLGIVVGMLIALSASAQASAYKTSTELARRIFLPLTSRQASGGPASGSLFGVGDTSEFALAYSPQGMNLAITGGVSALRTSVVWSTIEPVKTSPEHFDWALADGILVPLTNLGFSPLVLILGNPSWAANTPCGPLYDPNDIVAFTRALGARYPGIKYWALYNEVDLTTYSRSGVHNGGCFGEADIDKNGVPDYADYAELMRAARAGLRSGNPAAKLVFGVLAYDNFDPADSPPGYPGGCCFGYSFLDHLLEYMRAHPLAPGEEYSDVLGFNNYVLYDGAYWEHHFAGDGISAKVSALQAVAQKYGFAFPMLASEVSASTTSPSRPDSFHQQALDLAELYIQSSASGLEQSIWWPFADPCPMANAAVNLTAAVAEYKLWGHLTGTPANPNEVSTCAGWTFGIVDNDLTPKLSYFAFKTASEQLRDWKPAKVSSKRGLFKYSFVKDGQEKRVYYTKDGTVHAAWVKARWIRVVDMYGAPTVFKSNGAARITFFVGADPLYVELDP